jgi:peroxiredoxin
MEAAVADVGSKAPEFELKDFNNEKRSLRSLYADKPVLLVFYPFAFSGICTGELCRLRDDFSAFGNVQVVGVSVDTPYSLKVWAEQQGYQFPLLSDFWPHGQVAQQYGVFNEKAGMANRGTFLIDQTGTVRFAEVNGPGEARDQEAWKKAIASL